MSSIIERTVKQRNTERHQENQQKVATDHSWNESATSATKAKYVLVPLSLASVLLLSAVNDKLFFTELLVCSIIVLILLFIQANDQQSVKRTKG